MKLFLFALSLFGLSLQTYADEIPVTSKVTEVTVYRSQAKETRLVNVTIPKGNSEVVITGVSMHMIDQSLQVALKGNATLLSATTRVNYFTELNEEPSKNAAYKKLLDSILVFNQDLAWFTEQRAVYMGEIALIENNKKLGSNQEGLKPAELVTLTDFYRQRMMDLKKKLHDISYRENKLAEKRDKFQAQMEELGQNPKEPEKEIILSFSTEVGGSLQLMPSFIVQQAGWAPMYDIKVANTSQPVNILYKARIFQNTGFPWKDVKVSVSTANPSLNNNRPIMNPRFIDFVTYAVVNAAPTTLSNVSMNMAQVQFFNGTAAEQKTETFQWDSNPFNYEVNISETDINVEFEIDARQTIPTDGKEHICALQNYNVPATFKYHAVPKLDPAAFLLAKVTDYGKYNLLAGPANIFYSDMFVGQTNLNPAASGDTLLISLGRDERIVIKRNKLQDKSSKKILSDTQKDTYVYETIIRNNKTTAIEIEILDQVPISKQKTIEVEIEEKGNAEYNEEYGKLLWNLKIKPNETAKIKLGYSVEYPKGKQVTEQ
jgi:uncharacterized protein (TIGR02231 family)